MSINKNIIFNLKSQKGFTMYDLIIALVIFTIFVGIIGTLFYSINKVNLQSKLTAEATSYAILILEDIDKISYEQVSNSLADSYISKFSIPAGFNVRLDVTNYEGGTEDLIKRVKLTVSYSFQGNTENLIIDKLKIKEL